MSGRAVVDRAVYHSSGLHGHCASLHQQQPQSSSFDPAEWSYPAADSNLGASAAAGAAAYSGKEILCNVRKNPFSQQQPANSLYGGCAAQPELEQRARIWDAQHEEWGGSQLPEVGPDRGLADTTADAGDDDALAAEFVAELHHLWSADHIQNGPGAAESGSACIFAAVQHAAIPICLPADI